MRLPFWPDLKPGQTVSLRPLSGAFGGAIFMRQRKSTATASYGSGTQVNRHDTNQLGA
jgi:hypothetical protein